MVGIGYDVHKLAQGESLILAGVKIESEIGTVAHSDGDVLIHAVIDAILGAAGLGDIGEHFPDTDPKYKDASSMDLFKHVLEIISLDYALLNIDATLIMEKPKILPYKDEMKKNIQALTKLPPIRINIKATTNEKMGFLGRSEGVAAIAICELQSK